MYLDFLLELVNKTYQELYNKSYLEIIKESNYIYKLRFETEVITVDKSVGNKYRLTFEEFDGTIDDFIDLYDVILGFNRYCCDTSYFIDLTEEFIRKIALYFNYTYLY